MLVKVKGGWKIKTEKGRTYPKIYKTRSLGEKRIGELLRHAEKRSTRNRAKN